MAQEEFDQRVRVMDATKRIAFEEALIAFKVLADRGDMMYAHTPEIVALTQLLAVPGMPDPILLYPGGQFAVRTLPGDFARCIAGLTGTRYRCIR